jgi:hypothetical protein
MDRINDNTDDSSPFNDQFDKKVLALLRSNRADAGDELLRIYEEVSDGGAVSVYGSGYPDRYYLLLVFLPLFALTSISSFCPARTPNPIGVP